MIFLFIWCGIRVPKPIKISCVHDDFHIFFKSVILKILSDEDKKSEYDQFGYVDPNESNRRQHDPFGHRGQPFHHFQHFDFGHGGFKFSSSRSSDPRRVTLNRLEEGILPQSWRKPYLLLLTGNFCFNCMNIEGVWSDLAPEIEELGKAFATI